jgi:hypothetical protein
MKRRLLLLSILCLAFATRVVFALFIRMTRGCVWLATKIPQQFPEPDEHAEMWRMGNSCHLPRRPEQRTH